MQETDFSTETYPSQNADLQWNHNVRHRVGSNSLGSNLNSTYGNFNGYIAEFNFLDGYAYDPSYFAETDAVTGQWNPKKYTGSYGTNGFYLNFSDNSAATATTLGKDSSGNGNNFTPNGYVTGDAVKDSPTNNFAVLRTHSTPEASGVSKTEGNLKYTTGSSGGAGTQNRIAISTFLPTSGKWYAEVIPTSGSGNQSAGIIPYAVEDSPTTDRARYNLLNFNNGDVLQNLSGSGQTLSGHGSNVGTNEVLCIYMDMDAKTVYYGKNGQWANGSGSWNQSTPTSGLALGNSFFNNKTGGHEGFGITITSVTGGASITCMANFGQDSTFGGTLSAGGNVDANGKGDFKYTVPANALAMCSANLPDPTIKLPNKHFDTLLYTGNGGSNSITGLQFQPDWLWIKNRGQADNHQLHDAIRGASKGLISNLNNAEYTDVNAVTAFDSNGFSMNNNYDSHNKSSETYVAWNWNAGDTDGKTYTVTVVSDSGNKYRFDGYGTSAVTLDLAEGGTYIFNYPSAHPFRFSTTADGTHGGGSEYTTGVTVLSSTSVQIVVAASAPTLYYYCTIHSGMGGAINTNSTLGSSNFDGSIQSTVKVNATAGFSILTYTGTGSNATIGHGLGVTPNAIIVKRRNGSQNWGVYHSSIAPNDILQLDVTNSVYGGSGVFGNALATSSVFSVNAGSGMSNGNGDTYVAYCFSSVAGYSKFGSYIGNGNTKGTFIFTGFRPAWVLLKRTDTSKNWILHDSKRDGFNVTNEILYPNTSEAETNNAVDIDILSNGFKLRSSGAAHNASGGTYIYLAFAESPFKNARAR